MTTTIERIQIVEIAETVCESLLEMTLHDVENLAAAAALDGHSATATVHISGATNVSVVLSGSAVIARRAAAAMFEMDEADLGDEEIADAFGEIANIVAGNIKSLLPEPSQLSLPAVSQGADLIVTIPGADLLEHVDLGCFGDLLSVALWSRDGADGTGQD